MTDAFVKALRRLAEVSFARGGFAALALLCFVGGSAFSQDPLGAREKFRGRFAGRSRSRSRAGELTASTLRPRWAEPVHAAADGVCIYAGDEMKTYGKLVAVPSMRTASSPPTRTTAKRRQGGQQGKARAGHRQVRRQRRGLLAAAAFRIAQGRQARRPHAVPGSAIGRSRFERFQGLREPRVHSLSRLLLLLPTAPCRPVTCRTMTSSLKLGMKPREFWSEVKKLAKDQHGDEILIYMGHMLRKADQAGVSVKRKL